MSLTKCARCKKPFNKLRSTICPQCHDDEERDYDQIRDAMREHEGRQFNAEEMAKLVEVDIAVVLRMLDEGLLSNVEIGKSVICGMCGAPAISMRKKLCQRCLIKLDQKVAMQRAQMRSAEKKVARVDEQLESVHETLDNKRH